MRVPQQSRPMARNMMPEVDGSGLAGIYPSKKVEITGSAACKKGRMVQSTASATVCGDTNTFHTDCTTAKNNAKAALNCTNGYVAQHTGTCSQGAKC